jgi:DNA-binding response OmpR family regulator
MAMSNKTILVVDDEAAQRRLIREILKTQAYTVLEAADYDDALAVQMRHPGAVDLLLIDLSLPGGSGYDLSKALLAVEPHLSVIFVSGRAGAALCKFFEMQKPDMQFLQKPFQPADLLRRVRSVLESSDPAEDHAAAS